MLHRSFLIAHKDLLGLCLYQSAVTIHNNNCARGAPILQSYLEVREQGSRTHIQLFHSKPSTISQKLLQSRQPKKVPSYPTFSVIRHVNRQTRWGFPTGPSRTAILSPMTIRFQIWTVPGPRSNAEIRTNSAFLETGKLYWSRNMSFDSERKILQNE